MNLKKITFFILFVVLWLVVLQTPLVSLAETPLIDIIRKGDAPLKDVFGTPADIRVIAANIIKVLLSLLGILYLCYVVYGGFVWMTAAGNEERIRLAKSTILTGAVGVGIIVSAFSIARLVVVAFNCSVQPAARFCLFLNNLAF